MSNWHLKMCTSLLSFAPSLLCCPSVRESEIEQVDVVGAVYSNSYFGLWLAPHRQIQCWRQYFYFEVCCSVPQCDAMWLQCGAVWCFSSSNQTLASVLLLQSVLQRAAASAVCCSVLLLIMEFNTGVSTAISKWVASCCSVLQCVAVRCSALQRATLCCNVLQHLRWHITILNRQAQNAGARVGRSHTATHCNTLQQKCTGTRCRRWNGSLFSWTASLLFFHTFWVC